MAIGDLLPAWPLRSKIAWLGVKPPKAAKDAFEARDFIVEKCSISQLKDEDYLSEISAVVLSQSEKVPDRLRSQLEKFAPRILDFGCLVLVRPSKAESAAGLTILSDMLAKLKLPVAGLPTIENAIPPFIGIYDIGASWQKIANDVFRYSVGPRPEKLDVDFAKSPRPSRGDGLSRSERRVRKESIDVLLRRAFWSCKHAHLVPLSGGFSGAQVFCAYLEFPAAATLPFFVKIDKRHKIVKEHHNYHHMVDPFIPFHLGPQLVEDRCFLGSRYGVIVGDFVEGSEMLVRGACEGRAMSPIACLFDRTLRGWYRTVEPKDQSLPEVLRFPQKPKQTRFLRAQQLGATKRMYDLRALYRLCNSKPILVGHIHGDLHASNVCVRANDAIVIDFHSQQHAPLAYDAACLEASLLVDGFHNLHLKEIEAWRDAVSFMYDKPTLDANPPCPLPRDRYAWFQSSVRQIRMYARDMVHSSEQYFAALAVALLQKAYFQADAPEPESSRRAVAYLLAEKILTTTFAPPAAVAPAPAPAIAAAMPLIQPQLHAP